MRIAITGGIGSGNIARELMKKGNSNYLSIVDMFGTGILDDAGEIDRLKLRNIVFHDDKERQLLNRITHPNIMKKAMEESDGNGIYFIEVPLLFEENLESYFDKFWVVDCSEETQIDRVTKRSSLSKDEVLDIIRCQMPRKDRIRKADVVINSERQDLYEYIDELLISLEKAGNQ
jgi:dephospho-CoA kinase